MAKRTLVIAAILFISVTAAAWYAANSVATGKHAAAGNHTAAAAPDNKTINLRLSARAKAIRQFAAARGYDGNTCFLIDMRLPSGSKRFFVYHLKKDSVMDSGLVTHGSGSEGSDGRLTFSNTPGSLSTSLGRYKIGASYNGQFGLAYKLHGLDKTNSKALERFVVLHAHGCVPVEEVSPQPICVSWGCPTVAPAFLQTLRRHIERAAKPVLLEIYY